MTDLLDTPLAPDEIAALPERLARRYWAAEISHGVSGLADLDRTAVRHECRVRIAWHRDLAAGEEARYIGISSALLGRECRVENVGEDISISVPGFADRFLVGRHELEAI